MIIELRIREFVYSHIRNKFAIRYNRLFYMNLKRKKDYFKETLKDYLSFSRQERRGLFAVIIILFVLILTKLGIEYWPKDNSQTDFSKFDKEVSDFLASKKADSDSDVDEIRSMTIPEMAGYSRKEEKREAELFNFNPNGLPEKDWMRLGFSEKQIRVIKNYEEKGGKFYSKEDVKKMYSISSEDYQRIEPYIVIPPREKTQQRVYENKFPAKGSDNNLKVDVGTADTTELKKLRGIGTGYANRIVKYRTKLGGFHSVNQLHEVWGMNDSLFNLIADHIYVADSNHINRININTATFNELKSHPYFSYKLANLFINYRIQHGAFKMLADIKKIPW